jgi:predicted negative regulator of RcsB-dependent stress response
MGFFILLIVFIFLLLGMLGWNRWREDKYLKKKTRDVIDPTILESMDRESGETKRRQEKFQASLKKRGF